MRIFMDSEFAEDGVKIVPISLALVADDGRELYVQWAHERFPEVNDFVARHVLPWLGHFDLGTRARSCKAALSNGRCADESCPWRWSEAVRDEIIDFCYPTEYGKPEFWGYYADYDWVLFAQIFGRMGDLPEGWPQYCLDLKQWAVQLGDVQLPKQVKGEHHALADAHWIRDVWQYLGELTNGHPLRRVAG